MYTRIFYSKKYSHYKEPLKTREGNKLISYQENTKLIWKASFILFI